MNRFVVAAALAGSCLPPAATAAPGRAERVEHRTADEAPAIGPPEAAVTIELFFTPGAGNAHDAYRTLIELQRRHPTRVRAVFRPLHRNQNTPAITLAAHQRGRFFELMNALSTGAMAPNSGATLELAVKIGLSRTAAERAHLDLQVQAALDANRHRAFRLGTTSNPEMVINGRPMGPRVHAATATVGDLENEYRVAFDDARRATGQGIPARAIPRWGARREACGDDPDDERGSSTAPGPADPTANPDPPEPPSFAWHLAAVLTRGTGCTVARHLPATLDEFDPDAPPERDPVPLLARPLPTAGMPTLGPPDAEVPIFVVCNLRGRFCLDQLDLARRVAEHFPGQVRVVWVPWVDMILDGSDRDLTLAQAALCAAAEGDGWGFLRAATTGGFAARGRVDLSAIAAAAGLDSEKLDACASGEPRQARAAVEAARAAGIGWGPTVVIGGRAYLGGFGDDRRAADRVAAELAPGLLEALAPSW